MAWEPSLLKRGNSQLGGHDEVMQAISLAFPGTDWRRAPSGEEFVKWMESNGGTVSEEYRAMMVQEPSNWHGLFDTQDVTVEFDLGPSDNVRFVNVTSRGNHAEAQRRLRALARERQWVIKGDYDE
jgi:hypothetical protein